jgi:ribosomal-protein-alanine acetyltransferase
VKVRNATPDDVPAIRALASQSPEAAQWSEQHYDELVSSASTRVALVAEDRGRVLGFLVAHDVAGELELELENIAVAANARRKGTGRMLVEELLKVAVQRGIRKIHLEVRSQNRAARALYGRMRFVQRGLRRGYYDCPADDAILYTLEISPSALENI